MRDRGSDSLSDFASGALTRTLPQTLPTMHTELYPFVFFHLQNHSNKFANPPNTSTIIAFDNEGNS